MTPAKYIEFLAEMGIQLEAVNGQLKVTPASRVGPGTIQILRQYKAELLEAISGSSTVSASTQLQETREIDGSVDADNDVYRWELFPSPDPYRPGSPEPILGWPRRGGSP